MRIAGGGTARGDLKLAINGLEVAIDGVRANHQLLGHLGIGSAPVPLIAAPPPRGRSVRQDSWQVMSEGAQQSWVCRDQWGYRHGAPVPPGPALES